MKMKLNYLFLKILVSPFLWSFIKLNSSYFHSKWRRYLYWRTLMVKWPFRHHKRPDVEKFSQLPTAPHLEPFGNKPGTQPKGWGCQTPLRKLRPLSQCDLWPQFGHCRLRWEESAGARKNQEMTPIRNWQPPPKCLVIWPQTWFTAPLPRRWSGLPEGKWFYYRWRLKSALKWTFEN